MARWFLLVGLVLVLATPEAHARRFGQRKSPSRGPRSSVVKVVLKLDVLAGALLKRFVPEAKPESREARAAHRTKNAAAATVR